MVHRFRTQRRGLALGVVAGLALVAAGVTALRGQDAVRENFVAPGNSQPISVSADDVQTWADAGKRIFLLNGKVALTQGSVIARMPRAVVWIDEQGKNATGIYRLNLYGENEFILENGPERKSAPLGLASFSTSGIVNIKAYAKPVVQKPLPNDPLFQRARAAIEPTTTPNVIKQMQATTPAPRTIAPSITSPSSPPPASLPPSLQFAPRLPSTPPPATPIQRVQAVTPVPTLPQPSVTIGAPQFTPEPGPTPAGPPRELTIRPRSSVDPDFRSFALDNDETAVVYTGGIILMVGSPTEKKGLLDIEADRLIVWTKGKATDLVGKAKAQNVTDRAVEFYLSGNVQIRYQGETAEAKILRADEVYYDVNRSVAIAVQADLEIKDPKLPYSIHMRSDELHQLNAKTFQANTTEVFSTILPSDPGLTIQLRQATVVEREHVQRNLFGIPYTDAKTGQPKVVKDNYFTGTNLFTRLEGVPIFYFPYLAGRVQDPLGPLDSINFNIDRILGFQVYTTWDIYDLIAKDRPEGHRWRLFVDYLSERGPAIGTHYDLAEPEFFGLPAKVTAQTKAWGLRDRGKDIIGGARGEFAFVTQTLLVPVEHPEYRGRFKHMLNVQELPLGYSFQGQVSLLSDRNFLEQFYLDEFFNDYNQETFAYLKQQQDNWAWSLLGEVRLRHFVTETNWLPRADGYLLGQSIFDIFTYNGHASAGYAQLRPTDVPPFAFMPTDVRTDTVRLDLWQDLSLPFYVGAVKVAPYVAGDLAFYSEDVSGESRGRAYGGGGVRASLPLSRLYADVDSDLFNLNGLYHKMVFSGNYYNAFSSVSFQELPQLDRLNDDVTDLTLRQMRIFQTFLNPTRAEFLTTSPVFDPQRFAIRRLVDNRVDTLDDIEVFQMGLRQRLQTKRGFPGSEHVVDWMTLDLRASLFPRSDRDNFGNALGILEYDFIWNIGDRTAITSSGWTEAIDDGPRVFNVGVLLNRPDATNFYLGYRQIDPVESQAIIASVSYAFSAKYAVTASTTWDFGVDNKNYTLMLNRMGTDLQVGLGVSYNSILNNLGVNFQIVPTLLRGSLPMGPGTAVAGPGTNTASASGR